MDDSISHLKMDLALSSVLDYQQVWKVEWNPIQRFATVSSPSRNGPKWDYRGDKFDKKIDLDLAFDVLCATLDDMEIEYTMKRVPRTNEMVSLMTGYVFFVQSSRKINEKDYEILNEKLK
jgi:hypothetical protein